MEDITINDTEAINNHKLYLKGNANIPARFWQYRLYSINRPFNKAELLKMGFVQYDLTAAIKRYNGVSYSLLSN